MLRPVRVRNYTSVMRGRGISAERVLRGTGIEPGRLQDGDYLVSPVQCQAMIANMINVSGDPGIGFDAGGGTDLMSLGVMGGALLSCDIMRRTLDVWDRFSLPMLGILSRLRVQELDGERVAVIVDSLVSSPAIQMFCVEEVLAMTYKTGKVMSGLLPDVLEMEFAYPAPPHRRRYEETFNCPIRFDAHQTRAVFARHWIDMPLRTTDAEFNRVCVEHCGRMEQEIDAAHSMARRLRARFRQDPRAIPSLEEAAQELRMSARTMKRRLQGEGLTYQVLVRRFRGDLARELLGAARLPTKKVADRLGFGDVHSFRRAFKSWTGATVGEFLSESANSAA